MLDLASIKARLAAASPGPWRWAYAYQHRGTHWSLENGKSAQLGMTINYHLVTLDTAEYDYDDDDNATRLDQTPDFLLIAHAPADLSALIDRIEALEAALRPFAEQCYSDMDNLLVARKLLGMPDFPPLSETLARLRELVGSHFDGVDPVAYVAELRGDD